MTTSSPTSNLQRLELLEKRCEEQGQRIAELERIVRAIGAVFGGAAASGGASDRELDGQYGDPELKFVPRDWTAGGVTKGQKFSRCPADFLDVLAETMDVFAERNDAKGEKDSKGRPKSHWDRQNAKLARGWARRIRDGWKPPAPPAGFGPSSAPGTNPFAGPPVDWRNSRVMPPAAKPAAPPPPSEPAVDEDSGDDFPFGANVAPKPAPAPALLDDDDDDLPLQAAREAAQ